MIKELIITADDYGMSASVNSAIEECISAGTVHSTCVMTNMPDCERASQLRRRFPGVSVGIHWTLTQGYPVLSPSLIPTLTDDNGRFVSVAEFRKRWFKGRIRKQDIREELIAQHQRFRDIVGKAGYWNSHQNVHVWPILFCLFTELARDLGIDMMRCRARVTQPYRGTAAQYNLRHPLYYLKGKVISHWSSWAADIGMAMPAGLIYLPGFPEGQAAIDKAVQRINWPTTPLELVIHPAAQIEAEHFGSMMESRIWEYQYFRQPDVPDRLQRLGVRLVGFESLSHEILHVA